jgi:SAM-dependent methyltransferase
MNEHKQTTRKLALKKLNLGCGRDIRKGWLNCDFIQGQGIDQVFDASKPFPFADNSFDEILALDVLEHIWNYGDTVLECHRVLKPEGILTIRVPYGINHSAFHVRYLWPGSMDAFCQSNDGETNLQQPNKQLFRCLSRSIRYTMWCSYHLKKYLKLGYFRGRAWGAPFGKRTTIIWRLQKTKGERA